MDTDLTPLEHWAEPLLARLEPTERRRLLRVVGTTLRHSQSQRIGALKAPDGTPYPIRKRQLRSKSGRVKRLKMFTKLRQFKYLKLFTTANTAAVGFSGKVSRIARAHQEGQMDAVRRGGPRTRYEQRVLLGFTPAERDLMRDLLIEHLAR